MKNPILYLQLLFGIFNTQLKKLVALPVSLHSLWLLVVKKLRKFTVFTRRHRKPRTGSLVRRFQVLLLGWGIIVYLLAVTGFWFISSQAIQSTFEQQAGQWIAKLDELSTPLYASQDVNEFSSIERYIANFPEIAYIRFYQANGQDLLTQYVAMESSLKDIPGFDAATFTRHSRDQLNNRMTITSDINTDVSWMRVISPVYVASMQADEMLDFDVEDQQSEQVDIIGYIDMGLDFSAYQNQLARNIFYGSLIISIFFLIATIFARVLTKKALKPLLDLREPLERLARGETNVWITKNGDKEIVAISNALNTTINAIKGRDEALRRLADYDSLTGLINKRSFNILLEQERVRIRSEKDSSALLFIDLDQFKFVNDTLGHSAGDRLLIQIAELLKKRMRSDDVICRLGGDEFAVLVRSVDKKGALEVAGSIVKSMYDFMFIEQGKIFNIYCSIGVALIEDDHFSAEDIFSNADMACYSAKSQGRNRFNFYEPNNIDENKMDIGWSHRIAAALANDSFVLHYQPIVGFENTDRHSFEVLVRMQAEDGSLVPPNMFIPIAERFGLATEIDYWVIKNSLKKLEMMNAEGNAAIFYVNLSGQLFVDPDFVERVVTLLSQVDVQADQIVFELTERAAVGNIYSASKKMEQLRTYGFRFAVDDFGSGFSSFSYLRKMPVDFVKIEGEFVERVIEDEVDRAMVKSMVDIAKACGKQVVAEYVCDQKTFDLLKTYGIDYAQGFYIAEPKAQPVNTDMMIIPNNVTVLKV